ncbi:MAG: adenosylcobalamin-dependent ribonucleoside-diphosphate reductase [Candidatus Thermoplasmatota archaeon]|jgi:ribonucleoside-diphosphate reductase alpha chain|nr:adenosylcobalamin-dependent ribonucleoside-diphosphate reductase [Candidatus Thermoplasmatota archaeon]MCL5793336.1 adenosylcobalamin-dependent ribonucleoside-diphosphate reductase [Candidatus Thermoplasmatota archaeon]
MAEYVIKRDGSKQAFDRERITTAIYKAMLSVKHGSMEAAEKITDMVVSDTNATKKKQVNIEEIQDSVEQALMKAIIDGENYSDVARAYILYRDRRKTIRQEKLRMGVQDDLKLSLNSVKVLESRYLLKDQNGRVIETPSQMLHRVARTVALIEGIYEYRQKGTGDFRKKNVHPMSQMELSMLRRAFTYLKEEGTIDGDFQDVLDFISTESKSVRDYMEKFENLMRDLKFIPNSPTLMNAGTSIGQLSACFVLPVEDSIDSIFNALKDTAIIHKSGGGTGFSFSRLRPKEDIVGSTSGVASGPLSFMTIFDTTTDVIKQGGKRRGANMGILRYDHPDIMDFILSKDSANTKLKNFNISVALDADFFSRLDSDDYVDLKNPRDGRVMKRIRAMAIWESIINQAWKTGDPGLIFVDKMNEKNTVPHLGQIEATNPCGEQPLLPHESCNLGSVNLAKFVSNQKIDFDSLEETIRLSTRFLDDVIDANNFPIDEIRKVTRTTRKIGLGYMGFADMLAQLGISYQSREALETAEKVMKFLNETSHNESSRLAKERGNFPGWHGSLWERQGLMMRNSTTTTIAPTGTISIIADCSSSIEPFYALAYVRHVLDGQELLEVNRELEKELKKRSLYSDELVRAIAEKGNLADLDLPEDMKRVYVTAHEIEPQWHVMMQATFQRFCDSGVSKTINLPEDAAVKDIEDAYRMAWDLNCKGITVYRDKSKGVQVLTTGNGSSAKREQSNDAVIKLVLNTGSDNMVKLDSTFDPACPDGKCTL